MAAKKPARPDFVQAANKSGKEARESFDFDLKRRLGDQGRILSADDLSGLYDPKRGLFTTIDGQPRPLTFDDLQAFRAAVRDLKNRSKGKQFRGGIRPKQVIDLSRPDDRARAHKEIHSAMPVQSRAGTVHFQTNAGPSSNVRRHHVYVEFLNYNAAVASPMEPGKIVKEMLTGPVKFDCDCGRHTFWYRFMATIGGYNYGRTEDGYPRVRNPKLYGVACKHVIRVMAMLAQSPTFKGYAVRMIEQGRKTLGTTRQVVKVKEMEEYARLLRAEQWRQRAVRTTEEKRSARTGIPIAELRAQAAERSRAKEAKKSQTAIKNAKSAAELNIKKLLSLGAINKSQADTMIAALRAGA